MWWKGWLSDSDYCSSGEVQLLNASSGLTNNE
jgi:hypothetical protein